MGHVYLWVGRSCVICLLGRFTKLMQVYGHTLIVVGTGETFFMVIGNKRGQVYIFYFGGQGRHRLTYNDRGTLFLYMSFGNKGQIYIIILFNMTNIGGLLGRLLYLFLNVKYFRRGRHICVHGTMLLTFTTKGTSRVFILVRVGQGDVGFSFHYGRVHFEVQRYHGTCSVVFC